MTSSQDQIFTIVLSRTPETLRRALQAISVHGQIVYLIYTLSAPYSDMSHYTREYGKASSWKNRGWAPPAKQHTKNSYSGWSKRAQSDYEDRSRQWEDHEASGPAKENEGISVAVAEVEAFENRDKHLGRATADTALPHSDSAAATATEKEAISSRPSSVE